MDNSAYLAVSLNPSESHVAVATLNNGHLNMVDICTFKVRLVYINDLYYWDIYDILEQIKKAVKLAVRQTGQKPRYISIDCWSHDFGLFDKNDNLIDLPMAYQNFTDDTYMKEVLDIIPGKDLYRVSGNNFNPFNSIFQLYFLKKEKPSILTRAKRLLFLPDIINYLLSGKVMSEITYAITTQAYNITTGEWQKEFFDRLGLDVSMMPQIEKPGKIIGSVRPEILEELGLDEMEVILGASSDLSNAFTSFAEEGQNWAVIFSRTWLLMGIQLNQPILTSQAMKLDFTNSVGYSGKFFFQKAAYGLEILERCKNFWLDDTNYLTGESVYYAIPSFKYLIDIRDPEILNPGNVITAINSVFKRHGLPAPQSRDEIIQCVYESMGFISRFILDSAKHFAPEFIERIYMGNDGALNKYLCQCVANATGISVYAGNAHSSTMGNIIIQMLTVGDIQSMQEAHKIIDSSIGYQVYEPRDHQKWESVYFSKFLNLIA